MYTHTHTHLCFPEVYFFLLQDIEIIDGISHKGTYTFIILVALCNKVVSLFSPLLVVLLWKIDGTNNWVNYFWAVYYFSHFFLFYVHEKNWKK